MLPRDMSVGKQWKDTDVKRKQMRDVRGAATFRKEVSEKDTVL
jgi:hypothetical protein